MNEQLFTRKQTIWILVGLTGLGALLRFYKLDFQSLWYDELHSVIPTDPANSLKDVIDYAKSDQPPAYFIYLHFFFKLFGYSEWTGRAASALLGVASIPITFLLGRECKNAAVGLCAAALVSVNYFDVYYSQELRFYSLAFLTSALSFLFFIRAYKSNQLADFACYVICTTALLYTHYYGIVIFATQAIILVITSVLFKPQRSFVIRSFLSGVAVAVFFIPWLPVIIADLKIGSFWIQKPKPHFLLEYFYGYFGKDLLSTLIFAVLIGLFVKQIRSTTDREQKIIGSILALWLLLSYLIPYVKSLTSVPMLHIRYTIVSLPAWIAVIALGWDSINNQKTKWVIVALLIVIPVVNLFAFRKYYSKVTKQQFREAARLVQKQNPKIPVFTTFPWHLGYYFHGLEHKPQPFEVQTMSSMNKFWLVQIQILSKQELADQLALLTGYRVAERHSFHQVEALLMVKDSQ